MIAPPSQRQPLSPQTPAQRMVLSVQCQAAGHAFPNSSNERKQLYQNVCHAVSKHKDSGSQCGQTSRSGYLLAVECSTPSTMHRARKDVRQGMIEIHFLQVQVPYCGILSKSETSVVLEISRTQSLEPPLEFIKCPA